MRNNSITTDITQHIPKKKAWKEKMYTVMNCIMCNRIRTVYFILSQLQKYNLTEPLNH